MSLSTSTISVRDCSKVRAERFIYEWNIKDFKSLPQQFGECIYSPIFRTTRDEFEWKLCLYPRAEAWTTEGYVSIYLCLHSRKGEPISIKGSHAEVTILQIGMGMSSGCPDQVNSAARFFPTPMRSWLCNHDPITIRCEMLILSKTTTEPIERTHSMEQSFDSQGGQLIQDFRLLFREAKLSDINVIVGTQKFPAHKLVLATRSPVFAAMFEHKETQENLKNEIKIENMEPDVVKAMLEFIYTDEVANLKELAYGLLGAADKYDLQHLRSMCEKILYRSVNKENAAEILTHADLHRSSKLKEYVMTFMDDNLLDVLKTDGYKEMHKEYPALVDELMLKIALRKKAK